MKYPIHPLVLGISLALYAHGAVSAESVSTMDELVVEGDTQPALTTHYASPSTRITDVEVEGINATTVEDFIKYEPSLVVRRRYIGDSNGTLGIRGSNMFQTTRSMVYADGLPLHYLLQTRYSGAPRWSLVSPDETQAVEVVYGPFSAEYSGNAMGGVVNIETRLPTEREFHAEAAIFAQDYQHLGTDDTFVGHREFLSYGDKFEDLSVYVFHNHLASKSQPQSFRYSSITTPVGGETAVTGGITGLTSTGGTVMNYADSGGEEVTTDLTKIKLGYEFQDWLALVTVAFEDRDKESRPSNYLLDAGGNPFWSGSAVMNGNAFTVSSSRFAISDNNRQTALLGVGLEGPMGSSGWDMTADFSFFDVMEDKTLSSSRNPLDPAYTAAGRVSEYEDTGWVTLDLKARTQEFMGRNDMSFVTGYHFDRYSLQIHDYNSNDYAAGEKTSRRTSTGGKTSTQALFAQWGWDFAPDWDLALGGRYEQWKMKDGFYYRYGGDIEDYADRTEDGFSPKLSLGLTPSGPWKYRYSVAKAYRFPIVEELYKNEEATNSTSIADADLKPEIGIHHNLMAERAIANGFMRFNLFHETIDDVIFNQRITLPDSSTVSSFLPIEEVTTTGFEFVLQQSQLFDSKLDARFNVSYTDSEITKHSTNTSVVGNDAPRMPHWRANMLLTYNFSHLWDASAGLRYASDSYGSLDNSDTTDVCMVRRIVICSWI